MCSTSAQPAAACWAATDAAARRSSAMLGAVDLAGRSARTAHGLGGMPWSTGLPSVGGSHHLCQVGHAEGLHRASMHGHCWCCSARGRQHCGGGPRVACQEIGGVHAMRTCAAHNVTASTCHHANNDGHSQTAMMREESTSAEAAAFTLECMQQCYRKRYRGADVNAHLTNMLSRAAQSSRTCHYILVDLLGRNGMHLTHGLLL